MRKISQIIMQTNTASNSTGKTGTKQNGSRSTSKKSGKEMLVESLRFPGDVVMGNSIVTITGNKEVWVENYRGIIEYTEEMILLQGKTCQICFEGTGLSINYYTNEDMKIGGCIKSVTYQ